MTKYVKRNTSSLFLKVYGKQETLKEYYYIPNLQNTVLIIIFFTIDCCSLKSLHPILLLLFTFSPQVTENHTLFMVNLGTNELLKMSWITTFWYNDLNKKLNMCLLMKHIPGDFILLCIRDISVLSQRVSMSFTGISPPIESKPYKGHLSLDCCSVFIQLIISHIVI